MKLILIMLIAPILILTQFMFFSILNWTLLMSLLFLIVLPLYTH